MPAGSVLVGSTGRIGVILPMDNVRAGIVEAAAQLSAEPEHAAHTAEAIMTSDTRAKEVAVEFKVGGRTVRLGGICKGAGMIQPGMSANGKRPAARPLHATMLCFITTDAAIHSKVLQGALESAVAQSFNRITVDGDMSTNDTVLALANGAALMKADITSPQSDGFEAFQSALNHVCLELAKKIVRDGEGVSRFVTIRVNGAKSFSEADAAARAGGQQSAGQDELAWWGPELGPDHSGAGLQPGEDRRGQSRYWLQRAGQPPDSLEPQGRPAHRGDVWRSVRGGGAEGVRPAHPTESGFLQRADVRGRPDGGVCGVQ